MPLFCVFGGRIRPYNASYLEERFECKLAPWNGEEVDLQTGKKLGEQLGFELMFANLAGAEHFQLAFGIPLMTPKEFLNLARMRLVPRRRMKTWTQCQSKMGCIYRSRHVHRSCQVCWKLIQAAPDHRITTHEREFLEFLFRLIKDPKVTGTQRQNALVVTEYFMYSRSLPEEPHPSWHRRRVAELMERIKYDWLT
jgi:hypothetical protein